MESAYMTIKELAKYLRVKQSTVYNWVNNDRIPASKIVGQWRFRQSEIDEWVKNGNKREKKQINGQKVKDSGRFSFQDSSTIAERQKTYIEKRKFPRLNKSIAAKLYAEQPQTNTPSFCETVCKNISEGGALIEGTKTKAIFLFRPEQRQYALTLVLDIAGGRDFGKIQSKIAWIKEETPVGDKIKIGLEFSNLNPETKSTISSYIIEQKKIGKEASTLIEHIESFPIRIESSVIVKQPKKEVYRFLKNLEQFPEFMRDVKYVSICNGRGNRIITEWGIDIEGTTFSWKEEDIFDDENMVIKFRMIEGDFRRYEGQWSLFELLTGTEIRLSVIIDWGMPEWEKNVEHIFEDKIRDHLQTMLEAIKSRMWPRDTSKLVKFVCVIHTIDLGYVSSNFDPSACEKRDPFLKKILEWTPSFQCSYITGVQSLTGKKIDGELILCPLLAEQILNMDKNFVLRRVIEAGELAEKRGAKILGLAAYTAGVGRKGILVANALNIPVTTGTSYTIVVVIDSILKAAEKIGIELSDSNIMIVGATGSIGSICSKVLANSAKQLTLIARNKERLNNLAASIRNGSIAKIQTENELDKSLLQNADIIITATSTPKDLIDVSLLKPGALICDTSIPKNIPKEAADSRKDILVIDGGIVKVPGNVNFNFDIGLSPGLTYACIAEAMILALEERYECYSIGGNVSVDKVREISQLALKHGFKLAELRSFGKEVREERLEIVRRKI